MDVAPESHRIGARLGLYRGGIQGDEPNAAGQYPVDSTVGQMGNVEGTTS